MIGPNGPDFEGASLGSSNPMHCLDMLRLGPFLVFFLSPLGSNGNPQRSLHVDTGLLGI